MSRSRRLFTVLIPLIMFSLLACSGIVTAHRIHLDTEVSSYTYSFIELEAYYGDGKPVRNGVVTVYLSNGETHTTGATDDEGKFSFQINSTIINETLTIQVTQTGHKAVTELKLSGHGNNVVVKVSNSDNNNSLPTYQRVLVGLGYLLGLAGIASLISAWRLNRQNVENKSLPNNKLSSAKKKRLKS